MPARIGIGWDFHRWSNEPGRPLVLGGVVLEENMGLQGHSDADVVLHAVIDALLGAAGIGKDIGDLFPDTDPSFKNADSALLLQKAIALIKGKMDFKIANVDVVIKAERPRLAGRKAIMSERIAELLAAEKERVNIKAKSLEGLRDDGIEAFAAVLIE